MALGIERERKYLPHEPPQDDFLRAFDMQRDARTIEQYYVSEPFEEAELRVRASTNRSLTTHTSTLKLGHPPERTEVECEISVEAFNFWRALAYSRLVKQRYKLASKSGELVLDRIQREEGDLWICELEGADAYEEKHFGQGTCTDVTNDPNYRNYNLATPLRKRSQRIAASNFEKVGDLVARMQDSQETPVRVGIAGGTASGKSTLAEYLVNITQGIYISLDDYYHGKTKMAELFGYEYHDINWDHPESFDIDRATDHLRSLVLGQTIERPVYSMPESDPIGTQPVAAEAQRPIIIEGLYGLASSISQQLDLKLFVDAPVATRVTRRILRDDSSRTNWTPEQNLRFVLETAERSFMEHGVAQKDTADVLVYT